MLDPFCPLPNLDFDALMELAADDPEGFEAKRKEIIEVIINQAPLERQKRLRCLQWRIDQVRELSHTPMAACLKISRMMWDSVLGPNGLWEVLQKLSHAREDLLPKDPKKGADVLPFPTRTGSLKAGF